MDRLRLRIFMGSLRMLELQMLEIPEALLATTLAGVPLDGLPLIPAIVQWRNNVATLYATTADIPSAATDRPRTIDHREGEKPA